MGGYAGSYNPMRGGDTGCLQTAEYYSFDEDRSFTFVLYLL